MRRGRSRISCLPIASPWTRDPRGLESELRCRQVGAAACSAGAPPQRQGLCEIRQPSVPRNGIDILVVGEGSEASSLYEQSRWLPPSLELG